MRSPPVMSALAMRDPEADQSIQLSAVSGKGVKEALYALAREIGRAETKDDDDAAGDRQPWRP